VVWGWGIPTDDNAAVDWLCPLASSRTQDTEISLGSWSFWLQSGSSHLSAPTRLKLKPTPTIPHISGASLIHTPIDASSTKNSWFYSPGHHYIAISLYPFQIPRTIDHPDNRRIEYSFSTQCMTHLLRARQRLHLPTWRVFQRRSFQHSYMPRPEVGWRDGPSSSESTSPKFLAGADGGRTSTDAHYTTYDGY